MIPNLDKLAEYMHPPVATIVTCLCLAIPGHLWAQECNPHGQGLEGLPIVDVTVINGDIFDLDQENQNLLIHRWANKLHIKTRKKTIEGLLLFDPDEGYSEHLIKETERLLRSRSYIHDAKITAEEICGEGVKLTVRTTDNWTLSPSITASHSGGETRTSVEIEESNLLGLGTELKILSESDEERDSNAFVFRDANWLGDFKILRLELADNSDGHLYEASLTRPFIKQDAKYAWSVRAGSLERENPVYEQGDEIGNVGELNDSLLLTYGWSDGLLNGSVSRFGLGWFANELRYQTVDNPNLELPLNVDKNYPFFEYEFLKLKYIEKVNFRVMGITEDIKLGSSLEARIGWKDEAYGSTEEGYIFNLGYSYGSFVTTNTLGLFKLRLNQESNKTIDDSGRIVMQARLHNFRGTNNSYVFSGKLEAKQNPELFDRIEVGGDSGLKGYPVRFQNGDRALTLSAEGRAYFNVYLWQLVKFGFAVFAEAGSAWDSGDNPVWLGDVGMGLRLISTRQSASKVLHIDIAYPLTEEDEIDDYQFFVKAKTEF
ncbi:MAG: hypothetical protein OEU50_21525 [Gammaproteobacteria bacterium]|nr:hypothetical protein [Gammaproteobacteria bacterium]